MNNWSRNTLGNPIYKEGNLLVNNYITSHPTYNARCSYGNQKTNLHTTPEMEYGVTEKRHISPNKTSRQPGYYQIKSVAELKASGETANTMTNSGSQPPVFEPEHKNVLKMDEIGNLLSEFKTKFASIQQKYSLKVKQPEPSNASKYQPMTPQNPIQASKFDYTTNKMFLEPETSRGSKTPSYTIGSKYTFTTADDHYDFLSNKPKVELAKQSKPQLPKPSIISQAIDKKITDKSKFRATFGPVQTKALQIPLRKIRQAQEVINKKTKFANCKDVESETEQNQGEDESLKESVVISKLNTDWKKLRRTETMNHNPETKLETASTDLLKRFKSVRLPYS